MTILTNITITAYCACKLCCGPHSGGPTASGVMPKQGVTVAASRSIAFGTVVFIPSIGQRTVQDRLSKRFDNRIDVFFADHTAAKSFGKRTNNVTIITHK